MITALITALLLQAEAKEEIRKALPEAAGLPARDWEDLQKKSSTLDEMSRRGLCSLTFVVLSLPLYADVELDLVPEKEVNPQQVRAAIGRATVTCLQKEYIKDLTCQVKDGVATGTVTAEIPQFGTLTAQYTAKNQGVSWKIVEFRLPKSGAGCVCDLGGNWKVQWSTPQTPALSLVYSFGTLTCFGRKVYDSGEDKWDALEKLCAERESIADSRLILSGSGPGWTWATVRRIAACAKKVTRVSLRGGFEWTRGAAPADAVKVHLCGSKKHLDGHLGDPEAHARDIRKAALEPSFGDESYLWAGDRTADAVTLHHPMSDDKLLAADRKAAAKFAAALKDRAGVLINPDPQISFEQILLVGAALQKAGAKAIRLPD
jgi:hypothetical protein